MILKIKKYLFNLAIIFSFFINIKTAFDCPICTESVNEEFEITLECNHKICNKCQNKILINQGKNSACPYCKKAIKISDNQIEYLPGSPDNKILTQDEIEELEEIAGVNPNKYQNNYQEKNNISQQIYQQPIYQQAVNQNQIQVQEVKPTYQNYKSNKKVKVKKQKLNNPNNNIVFGILGFILGASTEKILLSSNIEIKKKTASISALTIGSVFINYKYKNDNNFIIGYLSGAFSGLVFDKLINKKNKKVN